VRTRISVSPGVRIGWSAVAGEAGDGSLDHRSVAPEALGKSLLGRSAVAEVNTNDNKMSRRICRNTSGYGPWAKCDFNRDENQFYYIRVVIRLARFYLGPVSSTEWVLATHLAASMTEHAELVYQVGWRRVIALLT
jgi:hypothetical protein